MKHLKRGMAIALCAAVAAGGLCGCEPKSGMRLDEETEPVVLSFFMPMGAQKKEGANIFLKLIDQYNASHSDVQVEVEGISIKDGYNEVLERRLASGQGDDLFTVNADSVKSFAANGYLCDLSGLPACSRLYPAAREQAEIGGLVYTIPLTMAAYGMYVNTDLLAKYGLEPPADYSSWMHCCQVLKEGGVTPFAVNRWYAMTVPVMARGLYKLYQSEHYGELVEGLNDGSVPIGDYMLEGFQMFEEFLDQGYYGDDLTREGVDSVPARTTDLQDFQNQKVAFAFFSSGVEKYFVDEGEGMPYLVQGVPALPEGTVCLPSIADRLCVNANSEHLEEALEVAEYITDATAAELLTNGDGSLPSREGQEGVPLGAEHMQRLLPLVNREGQIPIEDMNLHFTYWDTTRTLCLEIIDGLSAQEAAEKYNAIQLEQIGKYGDE